MPYMKYSKAEMNEMLQKKENVSKKRKRMKTGKLAFIAGITACIILVVFAMVMVFLEKDTQTNAIFGGAGVVAITIMFGIYEKYSTDISLKHMEKNYIPDYDEREGIY